LKRRETVYENLEGILRRPPLEKELCNEKKGCMEGERGEGGSGE